MKALTICQPYAHLIAIGYKRVENRAWRTLYKGPIAIHAGLSREWLRPSERERHPDTAFGAFVAVARITDCLTYRKIWTGQLPDRLYWLLRHEHAEGPFCFVFDRVQRLPEPIPYRGRRKIFDVPDAVFEHARGEVTA